MSRRSTYPNAENCSLAELETTLKAARSNRSYNRLMAIRTLTLGYTHEDVASIFNVSPRTIQRWVSRFNVCGIDGLIERRHSGRPRKIGPEQSLIYHELIEHPEKAEQTHWTARKFHGYLRDELKEEIGYSTLVRWLHDNGFRLKVPQPWPDRQDEQKRVAFIEQIKALLIDPEVDLWYADETGIEGDPRPRRRWAKKGSHPKVTKNGDHIRMNVMGMICPRTGEFYALEFSHSDQECFQTFLHHAGHDLRFQRPRNLLICDNASWHKAKSLKWETFEPMYLPPYSPDLNPIERLWLLLKAHWFTDFIAKNRDQLIERIDKALLWVMARQNDNQKTCSITTNI